MLLLCDRNSINIEEKMQPVVFISSIDLLDMNIVRHIADILPIVIVDQKTC